MRISKLLFFSVFVSLFFIGCDKDPEIIEKEIPVVNAGTNSSITLPVNSITLTGSAADADGTVIAYVWTQVSGPSFSIIANGGSPSTLVKGLIQGTYVFQLTATDNDGLTGAATVTITVNAGPNQSLIPVVNAGLTANVTLPVSTVTLTGSATDANGSIVAYLWSQVSGPSVSTIVSPGSPSTVINGLVQGSYLYQLMATDNEGYTGVDTVTVIVVPSVEQTLTLQPANNPNEKMIVVIGNEDHSFLGSIEMVIDAWTVGGASYKGRSLFKFDMSNIPSTATIVSANLYLYSNNPPENGNLTDANFGVANAMYLQQVTSNWSPSTATWFNQPSVTTANQVSIPHTSLQVLDLNLDVKNMVSSMVSNNTNYGFMLKLQNEVEYNSRMFVSSYHTVKTTKRPKLVITYR